MLEEAVGTSAFVPAGKFQLSKSFGSTNPSLFQVTNILCPSHVEPGSEISK